MSADRAARSSANTHDGASHHGRLGRPVASQDECRLAEAVGWVRFSWLSPRSVVNNSLGSLWGGVGVVLRRWRCCWRSRSSRPTANTKAPASTRAWTTSGLHKDAKTHQVRDAVLPLDLAMCKGRPQDRSCVYFDLAFGGLAQAWGRRLQEEHSKLPAPADPREVHVEEARKQEAEAC